MTTVQIELPDALAQQATRAGLLAPQKMQALLRAQLRREALAQLQSLHDKLPPGQITPEDEQAITQAVQEVRASRRQNRAG